MTLNKEELKKKIIYRSSYRGTKEMDNLMTSFVKSVIIDLDKNDLINLYELVNLDDESLYKLKNSSLNQNKILISNIVDKFIKFKC